jgi:hypothetical protein
VVRWLCNEFEKYMKNNLKKNINFGGAQSCMLLRLFVDFFFYLLKQGIHRVAQERHFCSLLKMEFVKTSIIKILR